MTRPPPLVSIVVVTWNALPLLERCFPSVAATDYPNLEIILADNGSTDGSVEWVRARFPSVKTVCHPENWFFCRGNNEAVRQASGKYVVLLNNDVEVPPDWLRPLVAVLEDDPSTAAVQPKLLQFENRSWFEYAGASGGFLDRYGYPFTRGRIFFTVEDDRGQYDDARDVFWATGAAIALRRSALERVGLLDERFELHMEEIDLCWRLQRAGYRIRVEPASRIYHVGGGSLPAGDVRKVYYNFRNSLLLLYKNLPASEWRRVFPVRCLLDAAAAVRSLVVGRPRETLAIIRAYVDARRMRAVYRASGTTGSEPVLSRTSKNEPEEQDPHRPSRRDVLPSYRGSVVLDHFLRRRKRFSDLPEERFLDTPGRVHESRPGDDARGLDASRRTRRSRV